MEPETIEAEVTEQMSTALEVSAVAPPTHGPPANLFNTEDPSEVIRRATAVAETLKGVLVSQNLISRIKDREHVRVEGWTLLGTMLGVFPVCTWTRKVDGPDGDGWEARVEARTMTGAIVGAAEAECLRSEKTWAQRDDYALRSMAQTRATSKALRQPLGFVVSLAGFDPTPLEEMPQEANERRVEGSLGPTPVPRSWTKVRELVETFSGDAWMLFEAFVRAASYHLYGETESKKLTPDQRKVMLQKAAGAAVWLNDNPQTEALGTTASVDHFAKGWAHVLEGTVLEVPDYSPPENSGSGEVDEEAEHLADQAITGPPE